MADLLTAVGGTGQHVALAVSRLVFLGALPQMELAVVDADDSSELSTSLKTFGSTVVGNYTEGVQFKVRHKGGGGVKYRGERKNSKGVKPGHERATEFGRAIG